MSAVVEALEGVADAVDKYIVEPIKNDPLTFIATVTAGVYLGPAAAGMFGTSAAAGVGIAAGAANTAAGLVQGEDFDDALKGGVMAGLGSWAGAALTGAGSATPSSTSALQSGIASTADDFGSAALQSTDDIFTQAAKSSADEYLTSAPATYGDDLIAPAAKNWGTNFADEAATSIDDSLFNPLDENLGMAGKGPDISLGKPSANLPNNSYYDSSGNIIGKDSYGQYTNAPNPPGQGVYTGTKISGAGAQRAFDTSANVIDEAANAGANVIDDAARLPGSQMPGGGLKPPSGYDLLDEGANLPKNGLNVSSLNKSQFGPQIEMLDDVAAQPSIWDKTLDYATKGYDWVIDNPRYSVPLAAGALYLGQGDKDDPPKGGGNNEQIGDPGFYDPMRLYDYNRNQIGYGGDITGYGRTGGEHQFFTPTIYTPIEYATGGSVAPDKYGYYTYGDIPKTMRGFAQGGLSALAKGGNYDGRSDDIPAVLSDGEFVIDAETVALLGNGSSKAGANRLEEMRQAVRKQKGGALSRGQFSPDAKSPLAYLKSSKKSRG